MSKVIHIEKYIKINYITKGNIDNIKFFKYPHWANKRKEKNPILLYQMALNIFIDSVVKQYGVRTT